MPNSESNPAQVTTTATTEQQPAGSEVTTENQPEATAGNEPVTSNGKPWKTDEKGKSLGFPDETPWREMAPDEASEYWRHAAQSWQRKAQNNTGANADDQQVQQLQARIDELESANLTTEQRDQASALEAAKAEGAAETEAFYRPLLTGLQLENIATTVMGEVRAKAWVSTVNPAAFISDNGDLNSKKVVDHLKAIYGDGNEQAKVTPPAPGTYQNGGQFQPPAVTKTNHIAQSEAQLAKRFKK